MNEAYLHHIINVQASSAQIKSAHISADQLSSAQM